MERFQTCSVSLKVKKAASTIVGCFCFDPSLQEHTRVAARRLVLGEGGGEGRGCGGVAEERENEREG